MKEETKIVSCSKEIEKFKENSIICHVHTLNKFLHLALLNEKVSFLKKLERNEYGRFLIHRIYH